MDNYNLLACNVLDVMHKQIYLMQVISSLSTLIFVFYVTLFQNYTWYFYWLPVCINELKGWGFIFASTVSNDSLLLYLWDLD